MGDEMIATVTISQEEYETLVRNNDRLLCLVNRMGLFVGDDEKISVNGENYSIPIDDAMAYVDLMIAKSNLESAKRAAEFSAMRRRSIADIVSAREQARDASGRE